MIGPRGLGDSCVEVAKRDQLNLPPTAAFPSPLTGTSAWNTANHADGQTGDSTSHNPIGRRRCSRCMHGAVWSWNGITSHLDPQNMCLPPSRNCDETDDGSNLPDDPNNIKTYGAKHTGRYAPDNVPADSSSSTDKLRVTCKGLATQDRLGLSSHTTARAHKRPGSAA
jgi:hypothetical protein